MQASHDPFFESIIDSQIPNCASLIQTIDRHTRACKSCLTDPGIWGAVGDDLRGFSIGIIAALVVTNG